MQCSCPKSRSRRNACRLSRLWLGVTLLLQLLLLRVLLLLLLFLLLYLMLLLLQFAGNLPRILSVGS